MSLTPEAKRLLAETIRGTQQAPEKGLRAQLLRAIHDEADRRYRLSVPVNEAGLDEAHHRRRERIEAWIDERARAAVSSAGIPRTKTDLQATKDRMLAQAEKESAATFVNRLVLLRQLEALGLSKPAVLTGGWNSKGYREFREFAPALCNDDTDDTEGYGILLQLVFDELATSMPGLFSHLGLGQFLGIPAATLRDVVDRIDDPALGTAWGDDTTLGWVYQYWNDPERREIDARRDAQSKLDRADLAAKTQVFTERYMVEWLLQNSIGHTWLCMCKRHGWTADAVQALPVLEARRSEWRKKRAAGEVALHALMPTEGELEQHWKYYLPQQVADDAVAKAPESVRALELLDPACGSGHFLVIAFGLLVALYREEARHRGNAITDQEIAESILENNLYGIDIDPRAVQIAAAGLYLKARTLAKDARPRRVNLVAPGLQLGNLPPDDPTISRLRQDLKREVGIPEELTDQLDELSELITKVTEVAEKGPPLPGSDTLPREADARFTMDLSDGVMVNSAALWPLLEPQWKDPRKWWGQLANRSGPKGTHFDWSKTAARYFPTRIQEECELSPVLAAAHRCLWRHHPKTAYEWELRLQHDLNPSFGITELDAPMCRRRFLEEQSTVAHELHRAEMKRRERRSRARSSQSDPGGVDA